MASLLAVRVLAPYFGRVTIVERDRFPSRTNTYRVLDASKCS
jgi:hypothetical protein